MTMHALKMYEYHIWANGVIFDVLKKLPENIYHQEINSGFSSISKVLSHIYLTDHMWFSIISGTSMKDAMAAANQLSEQVERKSLEEIQELFGDLSQENKALLNIRSNPESTILVDNPYAGILDISISEIVIHTVTHGGYHRGNIATMLRQLGHTSDMQDYILYLYK
ncbi:DinB family protein [Mesobacillus foraminis]|uniref:DinB family protein n=1 Tax=Mesobacillus foraminis TaxID=279826 RepID=UPI000EF50A86|nr:DinB family protein [Mesobacillus foraminis]